MRRREFSEPEPLPLRGELSARAELGGVREIEVTRGEEVRERSRPCQLVGRSFDILDLQRVEDGFDLYCEEPPLARTAGDLEEARLLVVPHHAHESALERHAAGLAASGKSFGAIHDRPPGIPGAKRAWPTLTVVYRECSGSVSGSSPGARGTRRSPG